jgi:hypothetical protein
MNTLIVNDRDLSELGFVLDTFTGPTDGVAIDVETIDLPGRYGQIPVAPEGPAEVRELTFRGHIEAATAAVIDAQYAALRGWVAREMVEIRTGLAPDKVFHGRYRRASGDPLRPMLLTEWGSLSLNFRCLDPLAYDRYERVITLSATRSAIPGGTGSLAGAIRVKGPTTSPLTITKRDHAGRVTGVCALGTAADPFTLGANDRVEINNLTGTIQRYTAGVMTDAIPFLTVTSDFPLIGMPDEWDRDAEAWMTLEVSGLSGGSAEWIGTRTWL